MTKKFLSVLLAIVMVLAMTPVSVFAEDDVLSYLTYEIYNGEVTITDCDESISGDVVIPDTIDGYPVTSIGEHAFSYCKSLTSITIPDSVTSIGNDAFDASSLTSITIPDSVTTIGEGAFNGCNNLESITIPDSVTTIGEGAFYGCNNLESITVDENNQYYSSDEYGVLFNKDKTELIQYPTGNTRTTYTIPNSVITIGGFSGAYVFGYCTSLESITIGNSVTSIGPTAFWYCTSLESVTIPDSVTTIGVGAFYFCINLESITIPDSVTSIGSDAFYYCISLESIKFPESVTSIGENSICNMGDSFKDVYIYNANAELAQGSIRNNGSTYENVSSKEYADLLAELTHGFFSGEYTVKEMDEKLAELESIVGEEKSIDFDIVIHGYENSTAQTYAEENGFKFMVFEDNVEENDILDNLTYKIADGEVTITDCNTSISGDVTIPDTIEGYSVTSIGDYAFSECYSLESITIADSVTSIGEFAFRACISLKSIMIPDSVNIIGLAAFLNCQALENITVDENNRYYSSDEYGVLFNKDKTELIKYPEANSKMSYTIPDSVITIADYYAISYCYNLKSVTIGKNVTTIGPWAFWWCTNLESVIIPDSVTTIVEGAFYDCISLTDVYYGGSEADWANISIGEENECLTSANIHYNYVIDEPATEDPTPDEPATDAPVTDDNNSNNNGGSESSSSFFDRIIEFFMSFFEKIRQFFASLM